MKLEDLVSKNPNVHGGDLVFAQTRIPAKLVIDAIEADVPLSEFLEDYPGITRKPPSRFCVRGCAASRPR